MVHRTTAADIFRTAPVHFNLVKSLRDAATEHCHEFFEIFYIVKGKMIHRLNGVELLAPQGSLYFLRPNDIHSFLRKDDTDCSFLNIAFTVPFFSELCRFLGSDYRMELYLTPERYPPAQGDADTQNQLLSCWQRVCLHPADDNGIIVEAKLLLTDLLVHKLSPREQFSGVPQWLSALLKEFSKPEHLSAGVSGMALYCGKTAAHISRSFQKHLGISPTQWLSDIRMRYAASLLSGSDLSIAEISLESGYASLSHMYHSFQATYHMTPRAYRKRNPPLL